MKYVFAFFSLLYLLAACNEKGGSGNTKMVYGGPKALVTSQPDNETQKGPLAYAPNVPKLQDGDTVEVKIDVRHKLFTVKNGVQFTGWLFGDSLPGPVLKLRVGQTVKFSMTDRSNDSSMMGMSMSMREGPWPQSLWRVNRVTL